MEGVLLLGAIVAALTAAIAVVALVSAATTAHERRASRENGNPSLRPSTWEVVGWLVGGTALAACVLFVLEIANVSIPTESIVRSFEVLLVAALAVGGAVAVWRHRRNP